ncbi:hypothetical protein [Streptomyces sp. CB00316]|uniref:hypothetical protein n=1 Tax=Streptomyces sp. CB00316 TaxID=1703932 RepID=UPI000A86728F|nr:hypothetical protein [Streptomyces sp. CB00316]
MQVETISALIGAAVAIPASGVAYAVGRHQAAATISAARAQVAAGHKQWRDDKRRSAWLAFIRAADDLASKAATMSRGGTPHDPEFESTISEIHNRLADVEFDGPPEIFKIARNVDHILTERLILAAFLRPYMVTQRKFDRMLAEARQEIAVTTSGEVPARSLRIVEANQSLEALPGQLGATSAASPPESAMHTAMMMFAPFIESAGREFREPLALIAEGIARIAVSGSVGAPTQFSDAERKLRECEALDQGEIAALLVIHTSHLISILERDLRRSRDLFREARTAFLQETEKHLEARLPVPS